MIVLLHLILFVLVVSVVAATIFGFKLRRLLIDVVFDLEVSSTDLRDAAFACREVANDAITMLYETDGEADECDCSRCASDIDNCFLLAVRLEDAADIMDAWA